MCERSGVGQAITEWEYETLRDGNKCPNCLVSEVQEYPSAGLSTNYSSIEKGKAADFGFLRCPYCGQGYNLTLMLYIENIGIDKNWIDIKYQRKKKLKNLEND